MSHFSGFIILLCIGELTPGAVVINEIHLNPDVKIEQVEFIELHNTSDKTLKVSGVAISVGVRFIVQDGMQLAPNQFALVIGNDDVAAFRAYYKLDDATLILCKYRGKLANNGEQVWVQSATDWATLVSFEYSIDGGRRSLIPVVTDPEKQALG